jgi:hypothetical protein
MAWAIACAAAWPAMARASDWGPPEEEPDEAMDRSSPPEGSAQPAADEEWAPTEPFDIVPYDESPALWGAVDDLAVARLVASLRALPPSLRLSQLRRAARTGRYLCDQAGALLAVFEDSYARMLRAAAILMPRIVDGNNLRQLVSLFPMREDKEAVRAFYHATFHR